MISKPPHNRKLGLSGIALTQQKNNRHDAKALTSIRDLVEEIMVQSGYLASSPFFWVTIAIRYGLKSDEQPSYQQINKKYGDLPLSIEVDTRELVDASLDELKLIFIRAVLKALIHAGLKYQCPVEALEKALVSAPELLKKSTDEAN